MLNGIDADGSLADYLPYLYLIHTRGYDANMVLTALT